MYTRCILVYDFQGCYRYAKNKDAYKHYNESIHVPKPKELFRKEDTQGERILTLIKSRLQYLLKKALLDKI